MITVDSLRLVLTEKAVEQALEAMRVGQPLSSNHPLRFFVVILSRLEAPEMLVGDAAIQVAVFNYLAETILQQFQHLRSICGLPEGEPKLEEAFRQSNAELEAWSLLYYRYVRVEQALTMQLIAHSVNQDERTLRRRHSVGLVRLTHELINCEQEARRLHRRQRLRMALPTVYPPVLIGTESLVATAQHLILEVEPPRHLILHGSAGIGKTSLALALAHRIVEQQVVDDILWMNLRDFPISDLNALVHEINSRLGLPDSDTTSPIQKLRSYCFSHTVLFVLDGAERLLQEALPIETLLHLLDTARVIITSRVAASPTLWLYCIAIPEFSRETAYKFLEALDDSQTSQVLRSFDVIWSTVGGNPLALKLMAGSARNLPLSGALHNIEIDQICYQIWHDLHPDQQKALLLTLLFHANAVPYKAFHTLPLDESIDQTIEALMNKSLLTLQKGDYFFYTASTLFVSFLLDRVRQGKDEQSSTFLVHQLPRQISFLLECPDCKSSLITLEIAQILDVDSRERCQYVCALSSQIISGGSWYAWFNVLSHLYRDCQDSAQKARLAGMMGEALRWLGEFERAKTYLGEAAAFIQYRAAALVELSVIARYQGYWQDALHLAQEVLDGCTQVGDITGADRCIHEISQIALESGDAILALTWLSRLQERTSRSWGIASQSHLLLREYPESLTAAEKALTLLPASHPNRGRALAVLGQIYNEMGQLDQAVEYLLMAVDLLEQAKDTLGYARASNNLAIAYFNQAADNRQISFEKVHQLLIHAQGIQSHIHDEIGLAVTQQNLFWLEQVKKMNNAD